MSKQQLVKCNDVMKFKINTNKRLLACDVEGEVCENTVAYTHDASHTNNDTEGGTEQNRTSTIHK